MNVKIRIGRVDTHGLDRLREKIDPTKFAEAGASALAPVVRRRLAEANARAAANLAAFGLEDPVDIAETDAAARREVAAGDAADVSFDEEPAGGVEDAADVSFDEEPAAAPADIIC